MKRILMAIMAVAVAVTFSAPSFAGVEKTDKKEGTKLVQMLNADEKKDEKKKDEKKDEKKKDEKKK